MAGSTPQQQLDSFIDKFTPRLASQVRVTMARMRVRLPRATVMVHDNDNALAIGFGPGDGSPIRSCRLRYTRAG